MADIPYGRDYPETEWLAPDGQPIEFTTWEPVDLGPYLRGEITPVAPAVGARRSDGQPLLYPGLEHAVIAHTGVGKTWFAMACVAADLTAGTTVAYLHFEESTPASTVDRLRRIGVPADAIQQRLLFAAPSKPLRHGWLEPLLAARPTLVVIDGVNEAMVLQGEKIDLEGWSAVRRRVVVPFKDIGAAVLECDHLPISADPLRGDAYGTVHKGNVIDGVRFALVRKERFGRGRRGVSLLYSTKDRPGEVERHGQDGDGSAVFLGTLVVDDTNTSPDFLTLYAPKPTASGEPGSPADLDAEIRAAIVEALAGLPDRRVESRRRLLTHLRKAGHMFRDGTVRDALDRLVVDGDVCEEPGRNRAVGYRLLDSGASQPSEPESGAVVRPGGASVRCVPLGGTHGTHTRTPVRPGVRDALGRTGTQSEPGDENGGAA